MPERHRYTLTVECDVAADAGADPRWIAKKLRSFVRFTAGQWLGTHERKHAARLEAVTVTLTESPTEDAAA